MLIFMFEKNGDGWYITDPNRHNVQQFHYQYAGKAWNHAIREIAKRVNGIARFTVVVEAEDGVTGSLSQSNISDQQMFEEVGR